MNGRRRERIRRRRHNNDKLTGSHYS